jgi:hypothetical protein
MTLTHQEFIRRFALHILLKRFVTVRPGSKWRIMFLSSIRKKQDLETAKLKLYKRNSK